MHFTILHASNQIPEEGGGYPTLERAQPALSLRLFFISVRRSVHRLPGAARPHVHADLGREHHLVTLAALGEPLADDSFGFAAAVAAGPARIDIGGVDQVEAGV